MPRDGRQAPLSSSTPTRPAHARRGLVRPRSWACCRRSRCRWSRDRAWPLCLRHGAEHKALLDAVSPAIFKVRSHLTERKAMAHRTKIPGYWLRVAAPARGPRPGACGAQRSALDPRHPLWALACANTARSFTAVTRRQQACWMLTTTWCWRAGRRCASKPIGRAAPRATRSRSVTGCIQPDSTSRPSPSAAGGHARSWHRLDRRAARSKVW